MSNSTVNVKLGNVSLVEDFRTRILSPFGFVIRQYYFYIGLCLVHLGSTNMLN